MRYIYYIYFYSIIARLSFLQRVEETRLRTELPRANSAFTFDENFNKL